MRVKSCEVAQGTPRSQRKVTKHDSFTDMNHDLQLYTGKSLTMLTRETSELIGQHLWSPNRTIF